MYVGIISSSAAIHLTVKMIYSEFFLVICSSLWIGAKLTIFFKRRFRWREHFLPHLGLDSANLILVVSAYFWLSEVWLFQMVTAVIAMVLAIRDMYSMRTDGLELCKSLGLGSCIIVFWNIECGSYIFPASSVCFALTQFLRWPQWLKDFLSKIRIVCGPAYPLSVIATGLKWKEAFGFSSGCVLIVAALFSSVAAIFFRPDNSEVLVLLHLPVPTTRTRKVCHAILMFSSLLCMTVPILLYQTLSWIIFKHACIALVILCTFLFLGATETVRIIGRAIFPGHRD